MVALGLQHQLTKHNNGIRNLRPWTQLGTEPMHFHMGMGQNPFLSILVASDGFFLGSNHRGLNQPESGSKPQIYGDFSIKIRMNIRLPAMTWAPLAARVT